MNRKPLVQEEFEYFYKKVPRITVEIVLIHDGGVVLTKRSIPPDMGRWHIPGGSVMLGETLDEAVHAVAKAELGVEVSIIRFIKFFYYPKFLRYSGYWPIGAGFLTELKKGDLKTDENASDLKVFKVIPANVVPDQKRFLDDLAKNDFKL